MPTETETADPTADPTVGHLAVLATYVGGVGLAAGLLRRRRAIAIPSPLDITILGVATFKLSRLLTRERVTQPLREPFTEVDPDEPGTEVAAEPRGGPVRYAVGELLTCPFCASVWIGTAGTLLFAAAPRATRLAASSLASMAVADASQYALAGLRRLDG